MMLWYDIYNLLLKYVNKGTPTFDSYNLPASPIDPPKKKN